MGHVSLLHTETGSACIKCVPVSAHHYQGDTMVGAGVFPSLLGGTRLPIPILPYQTGIPVIACEAQLLSSKWLGCCFPKTLRKVGPNFSFIRTFDSAEQVALSPLPLAPFTDNLKAQRLVHTCDTKTHFKPGLRYPIKEHPSPQLSRRSGKIKLSKYSQHSLLSYALLLESSD